jgi:hypothetical protein
MRQGKTLHRCVILCQLYHQEIFSLPHWYRASGINSNWLSNNFVIYLSGVQLTSGVHRHPGPTAWNQKWLLEDGPTTEVSDYCHAHSVQWEKEGVYQWGLFPSHCHWACSQAQTTGWPSHCPGWSAYYVAETIALAMFFLLTIALMVLQKRGPLLLLNEHRLNFFPRLFALKDCVIFAPGEMWPLLAIHRRTYSLWRHHRGDDLRGRAGWLGLGL